MKPEIPFDQIYLKFLDELDHLKGELRAEIILVQAHVEFMVDEILEILLESDAMRGTRARLPLKLKILHDLGWIDDQMKNDIDVLSEIRGIIAHRIDVYDKATRNDFTEKIKQIKLFDRADPKLFKDRSSQTVVKEASDLYISFLYDIYKKVYEMKKKCSLKGELPNRDNFHFQRDEDGLLNVQYDEI